AVLTARHGTAARHGPCTHLRQLPPRRAHMLTIRVWRDARTLVHLVRPSRRHSGHADQLEDFYSDQADDYDGFRERLLPGRRELVQSLPLLPGATWIDLGGGTARTLAHAGPALAALAAVHVVDLTPSLLAVAERRCRTRG